MSREKIKLAVSLYSFSSEYINGELDLEGILKKVKEMGYEGIEIVAAQMVPNYPYPTDEWLYAFKKLLRKYELVPVCWSAYIDMGIRSDRDLSEAELIQYTLNDMIYAKKAGFPLVRTQHSISPAIFTKMLPYCEKLDIKLAIEMHHPHHPEVAEWKEYIKICKTIGRGYLGIVPDCGIFQNHPHKLFLDQAREMGFRPIVLDRVVALHGVDTPLDAVIATEKLTAEEISIAGDLYATFNHPAHVEQLEELMDISFYFHGKFYYAYEGENDKCIPYDKIMNALSRLSYDGYMACEYEGHHFADCYEIPTQEQLTRYVAMQKRLGA